MIMNEKTKQLLIYIIKKHPKCSITSLMKLTYLIDLIAVKTLKKQISNFRYKRYYFGPFSEMIYPYAEDLVSKKALVVENEYSSDGKEFVVYTIDSANDNEVFEKLSKKEKEIADELLESVKGYGARILTEIAYKTKPMIALKAKIGNKEGLGKKLNLKA